MRTTPLPNARPWTAARVRAGAAWTTTAARLDVPAHLPLVLLAGFVLRLALAPFGGLDGDLDTMRSWAARLLAVPLGDFYAPAYFVDHLPGDLWILWVLTNVYDAFAPGEVLPVFLIKLVPAVADAAIGLLLFLIGRRLAGPRAGLVAAALFTFNPASLFLTATWGQWDAVSMAVALAALWLLLRGNAEWAFPVLTYAALIKPPFAALTPLFVLAALDTHVLPWIRRRATGNDPAAPRVGQVDALLRGLIAVLGSALVALAVLFPFNIGVPPFATRWTLWERIDFALDVYPHTTLNAFTLWQPVVGNWRSEEQLFLLGLTVRTWGVLLFAAAEVFVLVRYWGRRHSDAVLVWGCLAIAFASFMLPTAMHERYLFPALGFAALAAVLAPRRMGIVYALLSLTFLLNLYWVYDLYQPAWDLQFLSDSAVFANVVSLVNVGLLLYVLWFALPVLVPSPAAASVPLDAEPIPLGSRAVVAGREASGSATGRLHRVAPTGEAAFPIQTTAHVDVADRLMRWAWPRVDVLAPMLLALAALVLFLPRLEEPENYIYDEVYHAYTAAQYAAGNGDAYIWSTSPPEEHRVTYDQNVAYEWTHPPLGKLIIAGGIYLLGDDPAGRRIASVVFGAAAAAVAYHLGRRVTGRWSVGFLAGGLLLVDGMFFVQSRTATLDIFVLFFTLSGLLACHVYLTADPTAARRPLLGLGALLGLAIATKWNSVYAAGLIGLVVLWRVVGYWRASRRKRPRPEDVAAFRHHLLWVPIGLGLVPIAAYLATYVPFFLEGHSVADLRELHEQMWGYHNRINAQDNPHDYYSSWWEWPLTLRPVWYHGGSEGDLAVNTYTNGNPALFWLFVPAVLWVAWRWWRRGNRPALIVLLIGFFGQWLPWAFSPRPAFAYHFFPAVPFGVLAIAVLVAAVWRQRESGRLLATGYVALVLLSFAFFYPIYSATPLPRPDFEARMWIDSWR